MISPPVLVEPVNATLSTPGWRDEVRAERRAVAGDDVDRPGGEADLGRQLGDAEHGERRLRVGLEDDGAAGGERRRELPRRHQQRVVPRHDLRGDADRLLLRVEEQRAADRVRAPGDRRGRRGEVAEVLGRAGELRLDRRDRLADVSRLELGELLAVRGDRVGERVQQARALGRGRLAPRAVDRRTRGRDRAVDVGLAAHRGAREQVAGRGLAQLAHLAGRRLDRLAADVEAVLALGRDCHARDLPGGGQVADADVLGEERPEARRVAADVGAAELAACRVGDHVRAPGRVGGEAHGCASPARAWRAATARCKPAPPRARHRRRGSSARRRGRPCRAARAAAAICSRQLRVELDPVPREHGVGLGARRRRRGRPPRRPRRSPR